MLDFCSVLVIYYPAATLTPMEPCMHHGSNLQTQICLI